MQPSISPAAGAAGAQADPLPMIVICLILVASFAFIAFEKLHKSLAALLGAVLAVAAALALGVYGSDGGYEAVCAFIAYDLGIIGVIVGTSVLVEVVGGSGLFHFLAIRLVKLTQGRPALLLPAIMATTVGEAWKAADFDETTLAELGRPDIAGLVAVVQRRASEADVDCRLTVRHGQLVPTIIEFSNAAPHFLILACGEACASSAYQRALAIVRESLNPVLVV